MWKHYTHHLPAGCNSLLFCKFSLFLTTVSQFQEKYWRNVSTCWAVRLLWITEGECDCKLILNTVSWLYAEGNLMAVLLLQETIFFQDHNLTLWERCACCSYTVLYYSMIVVIVLHFLLLFISNLFLQFNPLNTCRAAMCCITMEIQMYSIWFYCIPTNQFFSDYT